MPRSFYRRRNFDDINVWFSSKIIEVPNIFKKSLLKDTHKCVIFCFTRFHLTFANYADRKRRGFKYFGHTFWFTLEIATGGYQGNCSIKVFELSVMFCSQITSYVANNSSCRILFGYYNVLRIKWVCLMTYRTALYNGKMASPYFLCWLIGSFWNSQVTGR